MMKMPAKAKAPETEVEATEAQPSAEDMTLEQLKARLAALEAAQAEKDKKIDELEAKEEGYLVWTDNPQFDGVVYGITFVSGQAWIPKDRVIKRFVAEMPSEVEMQKEANDLNKFDHHTTLEDVKKRFSEVVAQSSSFRCVNLLVNDLHFHAKFFTKDELAELDKMRNERAKERAEAVAREGTMKGAVEKMSKPTFIGT